MNPYNFVVDWICKLLFRRCILLAMESWIEFASWREDWTWAFWEKISYDFICVTIYYLLFYVRKCIYRLCKMWSMIIMAARPYVCETTYMWYSIMFLDGFVVCDLILQVFVWLFFQSSKSKSCLFWNWHTIKFTGLILLKLLNISSHIGKLS